MSSQYPTQPYSRQSDSISNRGLEARPQVVLPAPVSQSGQPQAAVVRSIKTSDGVERTVRLDAAAAARVPTPKMSTRHLDTYVQWLQQQSQSGVGPDSGRETSSVTGSTVERGDLDVRTNSNPDVHLENILKKLGMPKVSQWTGTEQGSEAQNPELNLKDHFPGGAEKSVPPANETHAPSSSDEIIQTVSQAIASVVNDYSRQEIENRIRTGLTDSEKATGGEPAASGDSCVASSDQMQQASAAAAISQPPSSGVVQDHENPGVPVNVAAWDVEDFHWPAISDQMLNEGAAAIDELAKTVLRSLKQGQQRVAVTCPQSKSGATTIAYSLARCILNNGGKVLLVDANLANAGLTTGVGLGEDISWVDTVSRSLESAESIIQSRQSGLCIVPLAKRKSSATMPHYALNLVGQLGAKVRSNFDLIIFDVGPVQQLIANATGPEKIVDVGLIVHDGTSATAGLEAQRQLQQWGLQQLVLAHNAVYTKNSQAA